MSLKRFILANNCDIVPVNTRPQPALNSVSPQNTRVLVNLRPHSLSGYRYDLRYATLESRCPQPQNDRFIDQIDFGYIIKTMIGMCV